MQYEELLTAQEVAAIARVHVRTFYRWCRSGAGPDETVMGGSVRYRESDVRAWMERRPQRDECA